MENTIYKAFNQMTRKMETIHVDEAELLPGQKLVKMFYCNLASRYVTIPGASLFIVNNNGQIVANES